jgi:hypothetical protein
MLVTIMLQQRVVGVVGLEAAGMPYMACKRSEAGVSSAVSPPRHIGSRDLRLIC